MKNDDDKIADILFSIEEIKKTVSSINSNKILMNESQRCNETTVQNLSSLGKLTIDTPLSQLGSLGEELNALDLFYQQLKKI